MLKKSHIFKTTMLLTTKFCTAIKTINNVSWVVQTRVTQIQHGGWPPSWKNGKTAISWQWFERSAPHLAWWCISALQNRTGSWNFKLLKIQDDVRPPSKNWRTAIYRQRLDRSAWNMVLWYILTLRTVSAVKNLNSKMAEQIQYGRHFDNRYFSQRFDLVWWYTLTPLILSAVKI